MATDVSSPTPGPDDLTTAEVAEVCGVTPQAVERWRATGTGPAARVVVWPRESGVPRPGVGYAYARQDVERFANGYQPRRGRRAGK